MQITTNASGEIFITLIGKDKKVGNLSFHFDAKSKVTIKSDSGKSILEIVGKEFIEEDAYSTPITGIVSFELSGQQSLTILRNFSNPTGYCLTGTNGAQKICLHFEPTIRS